jgi:capsid portal protein
MFHQYSLKQLLVIVEQRVLQVAVSAVRCVIAGHYRDADIAADRSSG